jgi:hypothetical protein
MTKFDSRLREALIAARDLSGAVDAPQGAGGSTRGRQLPQSTRVRALAAEQLKRLGFDSATVERELAAERAQSHRRLEELKAEAVAQSGVRADSLGRMVDAQRAALSGVIDIWPPTTQYLVLDSAVEIWATDGVGVNLESATIEPYKSRAQIRLHASESHDWSDFGATLYNPVYEFLHFYFLWENQESMPAVVDVNAFLILNGFCMAHSKGGWTDNGQERLALDATLDLLQTWTQPISSAPPQDGETWNVLYLLADSTDWFSDDQWKYDVVYRGTLVQYQQEIVPPGQNLIIDVALRLGYSVDNGEVSADFATGEFYVMSPMVWLKVVYPPKVFGGDAPR